MPITLYLLSAVRHTSLTLLCMLVLCTVPCLASSDNSASAPSFFNASFASAVANKPKQLPSFFGWKQIFYKFGAHTGKEDLAKKYTADLTQGKPSLYAVPVQAGVVPSGRAPSLTIPAGPTQAKKTAGGQSVAHPFIQPEFTEYTNPLLNNWGPPIHPLPFRHTLPHNPDPAGMNPLSFQDSPYLTGAPASDLVQHALRLAASQRTAEKILDPSLQVSQAAYQGATQQAADAASMAASGSFSTNMNSTSSPLVNVANEFAAVAPQPNETHRPVGEAIWIVQQMYKHFFLPLAVLLLLVGAVATQTTTFVQFTFTDGSNDALGR